MSENGREGLIEFMGDPGGHFAQNAESAQVEQCGFPFPEVSLEPVAFLKEPVRDALPADHADKHIRAIDRENIDPGLRHLSENVRDLVLFPSARFIGQTVAEASAHRPDDIRSGDDPQEMPMVHHDDEAVMEKPVLNRDE
jgi:hypothetical protein